MLKIRRSWISIIIALLALAVSACKSAPKPVAGLGTPTRLSPGDVEGAEPAMAAAPDGGVYVAWVNHGPKSQGDVMLARFSSDGAVQGSAVRVNSQPGAATAWRGDPPTIAVAADKTVFVGWTARVDSESGHATDIYLSASRDEGRTFGAAIKVNDDQRPGVHGMHSLAAGKDGRIYVAWLDERNIVAEPAMDPKMNKGTGGHHMESNREVFIASSSDGGRTFSTNKRVAGNVCPCCKTALAIAADGRVYLSWRQVLPGDFRHIAVASSTDQAQTFSEPKIVSDDQWMIPGCPVSGAAMSVSNDGALRVLWYSDGKNGETGLYSSESKDAGRSFGPRTLVSKGETRGTPVLLSNANGLAAVWGGVDNTILAASVNGKSGPLTLSRGELPAAVETPTKLFTAYIAKADQHQAVWIVSAKALD